MQWRNGVSFGQKDAQFGKDISFFAFDLPFYRFVLGFVFATVVVSLIAAAVTHYLYGGLRLQPLLGERATPAARVHLSVLLGTFVLLRAVGYWLDRYGLAVDEHRIGKADFTGLTYTDVNAVLQGKLILAIISVMCAGLFFANIVRRTWLLPGDRRRPAAALGAADRRHLPRAGAALPGRAGRARQGRAVHPSATSRRRARRTASTRSKIDTYNAATTASGGAAARGRRDHRQHPAARPVVAEPDLQEPPAVPALLRLPDRARRRPLHDRRREARTS